MKEKEPKVINTMTIIKIMTNYEGREKGEKERRREKGGRRKSYYNIYQQKKKTSNVIKIYLVISNYQQI